MANRILICEDEPLLRDLLATHLSSHGYSVAEAQDGVDCIRRVENQVPDLILLDLNLPVMSGVAVLRRLRALATDVPIVIITASTDPLKIDEAKSLGISGIIPKPFSIASIGAELRKHLGDA